MFKLRREQKEALAAEFGTVGMLAPCATCLYVRIIEIKGLFQGGLDDRPASARNGTTKEASYVKGYLSEDDRGRIYSNHETDGTGEPGTGKWKSGTQGIEITVQVDPPSVPIPPGTQITWSFEDPDDPSNEDPRMRRDAGKILDPNDYAGSTRVGSKGGDNAKSPQARSQPRFEQLEPRYPLSGNKTPVDPVTRLSKVRFDVGDVAGDNYRVTAEVNAIKPVTTTRGAATGIMTVWNRVDVEYVRMERATELPVEQLAPCFRHAFTEIDISSRHLATGYDDMGFLGKDDTQAFQNAESYATKSLGEFTMEGHAGWVLLVAANRNVPERHVTTLYEGEAIAHDTFYSVPKAKMVLSDAPKMVLIYDPAKLAGLVPPYPIDRNVLTAFETAFADTQGDQLRFNVFPNKYFEVESFDKPFLESHLASYGFADGAKMTVKILGEGEEATYPYGYSLFKEIGGHHQSTGRTFIFTKTCPPADYLRLMVHELTHAFECQHMCGNWDWTNETAVHACTMNYPSRFILDERSPRRPILWTQNKVSPELCPQHLRHLRTYHLDENKGLDWSKP